LEELELDGSGSISSGLGKRGDEEGEKKLEKNKEGKEEEEKEKGE